MDSSPKRHIIDVYKNNLEDCFNEIHNNLDKFKDRVDFNFFVQAWWFFI